MMAATPPRPTSPVVVPINGHGLQISHNLEALLEHDELTRQNSGSPTSAFCSTEFPISLPPPPPRKAPSARKVGHREEDALSTALQRKKACDLWTDALPQDGGPSGQAASSSRPVTPNPYLNPTPVWNGRSDDTTALCHTSSCLPCLPDDAQTPRQAVMTLANEPRPDIGRSDSRGRSSPSSAFNKVEKFLWIGRDSRNLFSVGGLKRGDSDRRNDRAEGGDLDAVQDRSMRQTHVPAQNASRPASRFGDDDTATSPSPLQQLERPETPSTRSFSVYSESGFTDESVPTPPRAAHFLPRLSLPFPAMSHDLPRPKSVDGVTGHDYLSFIDFFSQSTSDLSNIQHKSQEASSSRPQPRPISIPSSSVYSTSSGNNSSLSLATMRFAPPSPTSLAVQQPSPVCSPSESVFSSMVFAPPSPSSDSNNTWRQSPSGPPSPYSPLEFAPAPGSPEGVILEPSPPQASGLAVERGRRFKSGKRSLSLSPHPIHKLLSPLPPTTNQLRANDRADRVRRTRKLTRVFGKTPGTDDPATDVEVPRVLKKSYSPSLVGLLTKQKNHRHAVSVSVAVKSPVMKTELCSPWQADGLWSPDGRRHSIPLTTSGSFTLYVDDEQEGKGSRRPRKVVDSPETASTRSFIDLSEGDEEDTSGLSFLAPPHLRHRRIHQSTSTPSLVESVNSEAQLEADRRRKREKLAKLHRCLGSCVPPEAVIENVVGHAIPPGANSEGSARAHKNTPSDNFDRGKVELDEKEKALNVRRAQKMERVFGTPPPQMLYRTRPTRPTILTSQPAIPTDFNPFVLTLNLPSTSRNPNQSAYLDKTSHRRAPSDSSQNLLHHDTPQPSPSSLAQSFAESFAESLTGYQQVLAQSTVYLNYQHSLNSLVDIIDRDDRQSLVELHRFLHGEVGESPSEDDVTVNSRRTSIATAKSERRYSLPSKASVTSLSSELLPRVSRFEIRRRKAAKLTHFFGVDYHELMHDILSSIEKGVEEECHRGTLQPQEVEVLMHRVRSLRTLKDPFSQ